MEFKNLLIKNNGKIRFIIINRESKLNALNAATLAELHEAFKQAFADKQTGGVILTGAGTRAFIAGADISELTTLDAASAKKMSAEVHKNVCDFIENGPKPVIAAINGYALGGGLELAMSAQIRIAADTAKMGLPEVTLGLIPGYGGTQRLTALVGKGKAMEIILTADAIDAADAQVIGLVNRVVPGAELLQHAEEMMATILSRAPLAIAGAVKAINAAATPDGYDAEIEAFANCFNTADAKEGISAFLEKRKANFKSE